MVIWEEVNAYIVSRVSSPFTVTILTRCDGLVEFAYEYNGIRVYGVTIAGTSQKSDLTAIMSTVCLEFIRKRRLKTTWLAWIVVSNMVTY